MEEIAPVFRVNKRRKFARRKDPASGHDPDVVDSSLNDFGSADNDTGDDNVVPLADVLRLRKQARARGTGVQFHQERHTNDPGAAERAISLSKANEDEDKLKAISDRFVGSTGQVVDVDRHMMAYIDSEMAKRKTTDVRLSSPSPSRTQAFKNDRYEQESSSTNSKPLPATVKPDYPSQSRLSEFDLGPDAHQVNLARTEAAIARAQSGLPPPPEDPKPARRPRKPRLGRDGKPFRPRPRKRRNSTDVARDTLVEQILHENKMDVYEGANPATADRSDPAHGHSNSNNNKPQDDEGDDEAADDKLAEQFKQEFMDAMAERQQRHRAKAAASAKARGNTGSEPTGPKLGGSRSARAKMAMLQKQQQQSQSQPQSQAPTTQ